MNYRVTNEFRAPFRVFPFLEEQSPFKVELVLKVRADIPESNYGCNVVITFPTPRTAATVTPELGPMEGGAAAGAGGSGAGQHVEYKAKDRKVVWTVKKFHGGSELTLRTKITLSAASGASVRKELGPVSMTFEIPMYNVSNLQVRYLRIAEAHKSYVWLCGGLCPAAMVCAAFVVNLRAAAVFQVQTVPVGPIRHSVQLVRVPPVKPRTSNKKMSICVLVFMQKVSKQVNAPCLDPLRRR